MAFLKTITANVRGFAVLLPCLVAATYAVPITLPGPAWLRDAVIIEVPVRGFNMPDYNTPSSWKNFCGDGTYKGVTEKLDFIKSFYNLTIGRRAEFGALYFNGAIDDIRIYKRVLNSGEIATLYAGKH